MANTVLDNRHDKEALAAVDNQHGKEVLCDERNEDIDNEPHFLQRNVALFENYKTNQKTNKKLFLLFQTIIKNCLYNVFSGFVVHKN